MKFHDVPWGTALLTVWMIGLYLIDPSLNTLFRYYILSPWMHAGFNHFWNNMVLVIPLGVYVESRVGSLPFLVFSALIPYLALNLPVVWGLGSLSQGASGLSKALSSYTVAALLIEFYVKLEDLMNYNIEWLKVTVAFVMLVVIVFLTLKSLVTVQRFLGFKPSPEGVSVASHFFGLVLGISWFGWRSWRHGVFNNS